MPRIVWWLVIGMAINVTGSSFLWPMHTIYMNEFLDQTLTTAGIILMLNALTGVIGSLFGGWLFDRIGSKLTLRYAIIFVLLCLIGLVLNHDWPIYAVLLILIGFGYGVIVPVIYAMAGVVWPEGGRKTFNAIYLAQNLGVSIGTAAAGFVAQISFDYIFYANLILFVVFVVIAFTQFNYEVPEEDTQMQAQITNINVDMSRTRMKALLLACAVFFLCWTGYVQWQTTIATYTQELNISLSQYGLIWTANGLLILFAQPLIRPVVKKYEERLNVQLIIGLSIFIIAFVFTSFQTAFTGFLIGMIIMTFGEMFVWPALPTIANKLAPKGKQGSYQGVVTSTATLGRAVGPLLGGIIVDMYNMQVLFLVIVGFLFIGYIFIGLYNKRVKGVV